MIRALLISLCVTGLASAGVSERDLFEPGDGLLTYDDVSGREWLDFSVSSELLLDAQSTELQLPSHLQGFRVATLADVESLMRSAELQRIDAWNLPLGEFTAADRLIDLMGSTLSLSGNLIGNSYSAGGFVAESLASTPDQDGTVAVLIHTFGVNLTPGARHHFHFRGSGGYYRLNPSEYPFADGQIPLLHGDADHDGSRGGFPTLDRFFVDGLIDFNEADLDNDGVISAEEYALIEFPTPADPANRVEIGADPIPLPPAPISLSDVQDAVNDLFVAGFTEDEVHLFLDVVLSDTETITVAIVGTDPIVEIEVPLVESFDLPSRTDDDFAPRIDGVTVNYRAPPEAFVGFRDYLIDVRPSSGTVVGPAFYIGNQGGNTDSDDVGNETEAIADDLTSNLATSTAIVGDLDGDGEIENEEIFGVVTDFDDVYEINVFYDPGEGAPAYWLFREAAAIPEPSAACLVIGACLAALRLRAYA